MHELAESAGQQITTGIPSGGQAAQQGSPEEVAAGTSSSMQGESESGSSILNFGLTVF